MTSLRPTDFSSENHQSNAPLIPQRGPGPERAPELLDMEKQLGPGQAAWSTIQCAA